MNIVEQAALRVGGQLELAKRLAVITAHPYKPGHVSYWKKTGRFPADLANVVASEIFSGEITAYEACPSIKRAVNAA